MSKFISIITLIFAVVVFLVAVLAVCTTNWAGSQIKLEKLKAKLEQKLIKRVNNKDVFGAVVRIESGDG